MKRLFIFFWLVAVCLVAYGQARTLSRPQQAVLLEQAGSFYYVAKYATIDLDSSMIIASRSLGITLLPLITEAAPEEIPASLSNWIVQADLATAKRALPLLNGKAHLQLRYLLGSWYAFQSTTHPGVMDSAIHYLAEARAEALQLDAAPWARRCACLLGKAFLGKNDTLSGNAWLQRAIDECRQAADAPGEAMAWRYWGVYFPLLPALAPERIAYLKKAGALYQSHKDDLSRINVLMHIGYQSYLIVRIADAQTNFEEALRVEDSLHWPYTHYTTDLLAYSAENGARYGEDLRYALRSVKTAENTRDSLCWAAFYFRLGSVYSQMPLFLNDFIHWSQKALDRLFLEDDELQVYQFAKSLCDALVQAHRFEEVPALIDRIQRRYTPKNLLDTLYDHILLYDYAGYARDTATELKYALLIYTEEARVEVIRPYLRGQRDFILGFAWLHRNDYKRAEPLLRACLSAPWTQSEHANVVVAYWNLLHIDTITGHLATATRDYHKSWLIYDSGFNATQARQIELLKVQYEVDEKEKDILLLQTQTQLQEHQLRQAALVRGFSIGGILLLLVISGLLYNRYRLKQRGNRQLQLQKSEIDTQNIQLHRLVEEKEELLVIKDWLMKELNHRMGNNLHFMMSVQNMQANSLNSDEALNAITQSNNRLYAMSLIHRKLYQPDREGTINMTQYIGDLVKHLSEALSSDNDVLFETHIAPIELDISQAVPVGLILNEAITNAFKYAFSDTQPGSKPAAAGYKKAPHPRIGISLEPIGEAEVEVVIKDNGKGYTPDIEQGKRPSLGFMLMEMLTTQLRGTLAIQNDDGLTIRLRFPVQSQTEPATVR